MNRSNDVLCLDALKKEHTQNQRQAEAFDEVFQAHWQKVYAVLFRLVGEPDEAEDLAQEAFWRLYRRFPSLANGVSVGGWLYRVATRLGFNALRARKRRLFYEQQAALEALEDRADPDPSAQVELAEARQRVRYVLARMKPRSAQILLLRYSGCSYAELAAALGVAPTSIGTLLVRAEQEFQALYRTPGEEA